MPTDVVTSFLRTDGEVLLFRRSDEVGSYRGKWGAVSGHVADDDGNERAPERAARAEISEETGLADADVSLVRAGDPFAVTDGDRGWRVHPYLFDCERRAVETNRETTDHEWVHPPAILRRETVPALWTAYDRVRPRVTTVRGDAAHGSAWISLRALEVLRDEGALAAAARRRESEHREADGDDWAGVAGVAEALLAARPAMAVVANRVNRAMHDASEARTPAAVERAAVDGIERALRADREAAAVAADRLPDRVATLSRSGTVERALTAAGPAAVLVAESRPGREGVGVAERLAEDATATLTTDAAFPAELAEREVGALVVGADRVLPDGRVLNKVGTRGAALAAPPECAVYVVLASDKVATDDAVDRELRDPRELYDGEADLTVANPTFDVTPADAVDALLTERGALAPGDVESLAGEHRTWAAWSEAA